MSVPAIIVSKPESSQLKVAALSTLDRLIVTLHRAGCTRISVVSEQEVTGIRRAKEMGIRFDVIKSVPSLSEPTLITTTGLVTQSKDVVRVIEAKGRLNSTQNLPLPMGLFPEGLPDLEQGFDALPTVQAEGVACPASNTNSAELAARTLWASLTSASDGAVDRFFNRPIGRLLSKALAHTSVTPNQVSFVATLLGLVSALCFASGQWTAALIGAIVLQISAIIDCVDGDLARIVYKESPLGRWLDIGGDQVVHIGVFVCIAIGLGNAGSEAPVLWLGASAGLGVIISFAVVVRGMLQPEELRNTRLQKLIDATANRDFSALLIFLVIIDRLELFMWMTGFGVHIFWILALIIQLVAQPASPALNATREKRP